MLKAATRIFWATARVCWTAALLFAVSVFGMIALAMMSVVRGPYWYFESEVFFTALILAPLLPLTAPWVWFREVTGGLRPASWPIRANAYLIDLILPYVGPFVNLIAIPIGFRISGVEPMGFSFRWNHDNLGLFVLVTALGIALTVYYATWWFALLDRGQTPGKRLLRIRVIDAKTGETLSRPRMFVREFLLKFLLMGFHSGIQMVVVLWNVLVEPARFIELPILVWLVKLIFTHGLVVPVIAFTPMLVFVIDLLWPLFGKDRQTLHDKMVGSHVVHTMRST